MSDADTANPTRWQTLGEKYREHPLLYGTLAAGLLLLLLIFSCSGPEQQSSFRGYDYGPQQDDGPLKLAMSRLGELEEFDHFQITGQIVERLNQWIGRQRPASAYAVDPFVEKELSGMPAFNQQLKLSDPSGLQFTREDARVLQGSVWMNDVGSRLIGEGGDPVALAERLFDWTMRNILLDDTEAPVRSLPWESLLWGRGKANTRAWIFMELCRQQQMEAAMLAYRDPKEPGTDKQPRFRSWLPAVLLQGELYLFDHKLQTPVPGPGGKGVAKLSQVLGQGGDALLRQLDVGNYKYPVTPGDLKEVVALVDGSPHLFARRMQFLQLNLHNLKSGLRCENTLALTANVDRMARRFTACEHVTASRVWLWPYICLGNSRSVPLVRGQAPLQPGAPLPRYELLRPFVLDGFEAEGTRNKLWLPKEAGRSNPELKKFMDAENERNQAQDEVARLKKRREGDAEVSGFLWSGRMLQLKGHFGGGEGRGAPNAYQSGRLFDPQLDRMKAKLQANMQAAEEKAQQALKAGSSLEAGFWREFAVQLKPAIDGFRGERFMRKLAAHHASFWLGTVSYERGDYKQAIEYFQDFRAHNLRDLENSPDFRLPLLPQYIQETQEWNNIWRRGALQNLARALEQDGQLAAAVKLYESDTSPQQQHGSFLRARLLKQELADIADKKTSE